MKRWKIVVGLAGLAAASIVRADPPVAPPTPQPTAPATSAQQQSAPATDEAVITYSVFNGKFSRGTATPSKIVNGVRQSAKLVIEDVPSVKVVTTYEVISGHTFRIDHVDTQIIDGKLFAGHDFRQELPPETKCPGMWQKSGGAGRAPDKVVNGVTIPGEELGFWRCLAIVEIVGGDVVLKPTPWQAEIYSTAKYVKKDFDTDARLVRAKSDQAEHITDREAFEYLHRCGAVLIAKDWVVTAQHCIKDGDDNINPEYFKQWRRIRLGTLDLKKDGATYAVKKIVLHPKFDEAHYRNDIALIQFVADEKTVKIDDPNRIAPIRLLGMQSYDPKQPDAFPSFLVYGWGTQSPRKDGDADHLDDNGNVIHESRNLMQVRLYYVSRHDCADVPSYKTDITKRVMCAGYPAGGHDSCQGDSGGPLVGDLMIGPNETVLVGIVSGGLGCAQPNTPGIYTYIPPYLDWIKQAVGSGNLLSIKQ